MVRQLLVDKGFQLSDLPHALFKASVPGISVSGYLSGKIVIQGKESSNLTDELGRILFSSSPIEPHIGIDEAGKGDYFGPLVIAAVYIDQKSSETLQTLGLRDCKAMKNREVSEMAEAVRSMCSYEIVAISPARYNQLMDKFGNLNKLLAWGHARSLESLLEKKYCDTAISDKFASEQVLQGALMRLGRKINLIQKVRAEEDPAVAAASVLARDRFLKEMDRASRKINCTLPRGASAQVDVIAGRLLKKMGIEGLKQYAKIHFKTTAKATEIAGIPRNSGDYSG